MIIERLILLVVITLTTLTVLIVIKRRQVNQAQFAVSETCKQGNASSKPQLIYFWSTSCSQCLSMQTPIIDKLISSVGNEKLGIKKFNVAESPELVKKWGVKTVPTTYVLDPEGNVVHINNGLATEKKLLGQI